MKKLLCFVLALSMLGVVAGCGNQNRAKVNQTPEIENSVSLLTTIWESYAEEEMFSAMGPEVFSLDDPAALDSMLAVPEEVATQLDDAASLLHMMNLNLFTCGAFHVKQEQEVTGVINTLYQHIKQRQWICGFPDRMLLVRIDNYVLSAFGSEELMQTFQEKLVVVYPSATIVYDEAV